MSKRRRPPTSQSDLFVIEPAVPKGFVYRDDVITAEEEQALIERFRELPFKPFEFHGLLGNRRVVSFGWRYDFSSAVLQPSNPIPPFLLSLRERAAAFANVPSDTLQQVLINEYAPGAGIGWHRDKAMFEDVIAISLRASCTLRLRREQGGGWERATQTVHPRSAYLLRGPVRREWEHSVPPVDRLRYSVTFRNFVAGWGN
jgi:alkylated DNA repair dioxygenase AlkB